MRGLITLVLLVAGVGLVVSRLDELSSLLGSAQGRAKTGGSPIVQPAGPPAGAAPRALYRWRDAKGTVHITSAPPPPGTPVETTSFRTAAPASAPAAAIVPRGRASLADDPSSVYAPGGTEALIRRVDETARVLDGRRSDARALGKQL